MAEEKEKIKFEDGMKRLSEIVTKIESNKESLEDTIKLAGEAQKLGQQLEDIIKDAESKLNKSTVVDDNDKVEN